MSRRALLTALAAALLLLAGCQSTAPDPPEVTPVPVPTSTDTGAVEGIPSAHRAALDGTTYTTRVTYRLEYADGTTGRLTDQFTVGSGESYLYERRSVGTYPGSPVNVTIWQDGATGFIRRAGANETDVVRSSTGTILEDTTLSGFLARLLGGFDLRDSGSASDRALRDSQLTVRTLPLPPTVHNARNATLQVEVRDDVVRSVSIVCDADRGTDDDPVQVRISYTVSGIGDPGPTRPDWARRGG